MSTTRRKRSLKDISNDVAGKVQLKAPLPTEVIDLTRSTCKKRSRSSPEVGMPVASKKSIHQVEPWEDSPSTKAPYVHHIITKPSNGRSSTLNAATAAAIEQSKGIYLKARPLPQQRQQQEQEQQKQQQQKQSQQQQLQVQQQQQQQNKQQQQQQQHQLQHKQQLARPPHRIRRSLPLPHKSADPADCLDRIDDMYALYYETEVKFWPKHGYMEKLQKDINSRMRAILVDWLVEVHHKFKLQTSTLWLCMNILDRYLEGVAVERSQLQLVGVTALLVACKYEEIYPPEVRECVYITDYAYAKEQVLSMEQAILAKLSYDICVPTGYHFLSRFLESVRASERTRLLAHYYAERNMQEYDMLRFRPHVFAAAALYMALKQQAQNGSQGAASGGGAADVGRIGEQSSSWPVTLQEESGLMESDLIVCARAMVKHTKEEPETASKRRLNAVRKKYSSEKNQMVATLPVPTV